MPQKLTHFQRMVVFCGVVCFWGAYVYFAFQTTQLTLLPDFQSYLGALRALEARESLYADGFHIQNATLGADTKYRYFYPPTLLALLSPLSSFSLSTNCFIATAINLLMIPLLAFGLLQLFGEELRRLHSERALHYSALLIICCLFPGVWHGIIFGQVHILLALCVVCFFWAVKEQRASLAGFSLAFAAHLKVTPALLIVRAALLRRWREMFWFLLACLVLVAASFFVGVTLKDWRDFSLLALNFPQPNPGLDNFALASIISEELGTTYRLTRLVISGGILLMIASAMLWQPRAVYFLLGGVVLIAPVLWNHHTVMLLPMLFYLGLRSKQRLREVIGVVVILLLIEHALLVFYLNELDTLCAILRFVPWLSLSYLTIQTLREEVRAAS